jgi:hypothetical protein
VGAGRRRRRRRRSSSRRRRRKKKKGGGMVYIRIYVPRQQPFLHLTSSCLNFPPRVLGAKKGGDHKKLQKISTMSCRQLRQTWLDTS